MKEVYLFTCNAHYTHITSVNLSIILEMSRYLVLGKTQHDSFIVADTAPPHNTFLVHKKFYKKNTPEIGGIYFLTVREGHITGIQEKCDILENIGKSAFMCCGQLVSSDAESFSLTTRNLTTLTISDPKHLNEDRHRAYFRVSVNSDKHQALFEAIEPPADKKEAALKPSSSQNEGPNNKISSPVTSEDFTNKRSSPTRNGGRNEVSRSVDAKKTAGDAFEKLYKKPIIQAMLMKHPQELEVILKYFDIE